MAEGKEHAAGRLDALADNAMTRVQLDDTPVLLIRRGDTVSAVGAECPHAGADLSTGVLDGGRIVCPWHKACFAAADGALLEPPAVDPLPRFATRIADGVVHVTLPGAPAVTAGRAAGGDTRHFVVIGGGAAGAAAAQTLREEGFGGRLTLLDRAGRVPYDRTLLSKYFLSGEAGGEKSPLQKQSFYAEHDIERRTGTVVSLDAATRRIACADGATLGYDAALIAVGGEPQPAPANGASLAGVFLLRDRADADALLAAAERGGRAVVIGASFIGMEAAAALRERGLDVTVTAPQREPFEEKLGAEIGAVFRRLHESRGVRFRLGRHVTGFEAAGSEGAGFEGRSAVRAVRLDDGTALDADLVVVGFGITLDTAFAHGVTRDERGAIAVDPTLRAADGLYAAGDVAAFPLHGDGPRTRVEHWRVALQQGRLAARNMLGGDARYTAVPVFWTIQYMKRLDYVGHATEWDDIVVHGDLQKPEFIAYYVRGGIVAAAVGWDRDQDMAALVGLMDRRHDWTADALGAAPAGLIAP